MINHSRVPAVTTQACAAPMFRVLPEDLSLHRFTWQGYRVAYGLAAFVHFVAEREHGRVVLEDQAIRTHSTGNLVSFANGGSRGCHRLLRRNVIRLADFVLVHHDHVRHGETATYYRRVVDTVGVGSDRDRPPDPGRGDPRQIYR